MHFYRVSIYEGDLHPVWTETLSEAHNQLRESGKGKPDARIELFDVPTDKAGVCALLNHGGNDAEGSLGLGAIRTWELTPRGGIKEVQNGE